MSEPPTPTLATPHELSECLEAMWTDIPYANAPNPFLSLRIVVFTANHSNSSKKTRLFRDHVSNVVVICNLILSIMPHTFIHPQF